MNYIISVSQPHERFITIELNVVLNDQSDIAILQLSSWRPGRYELGNFAKNVKNFEVFDQSGNNLLFKKITKDSWKISNPGKSFTVNYKYYANQPDAGSCYLSDEQLYVNPVHCCMMVKGLEHEKCTLELKIPVEWKVATGLTKVKDRNYSAENFDMLVDSPFIASPTLQHKSYEIENATFHIWLQGECNPDWEKIIKDFAGFTRVQFDMMKKFPFDHYHFLVQVLPYSFYHGVEHLNSTVLALGPGYNLMKPVLYNDFIGVASHELFHSWNVKSIRPAEMLPYNLTVENYAETGYVYEGVTTYYGDLFLGRSGFFNLSELLDEFSTRLQKHMDNPGRFNYSVAESSFDTWLDGYVPGVPGRKTSIYDEGCLLAWILDFMIRSSSHSEKSLDDVMTVLYYDFALQNKGYTGKDYQQIAEKNAGRDLNDFFENYVYKASSLESLLAETITLAGLKIESIAASNIHERYFGIKTELRGGALFVAGIAPNSSASFSGLLRDDEIIAVNGIRVENNLSELLNSSPGYINTILIATFKKVKSIELVTDEKFHFSKYKIISIEETDESQLEFRKKWLKIQADA